MNMMNYEEEFKRITKATKEMECFSWTSSEFQSDVLNYIIENRDRGCGVIEVGCYKGGFSALLAFLCREFNWPFYTIDIDESSVTSVQNVLSSLDLLQGATIHLGTLESFVPTIILNDRPALIILDGDHRYEAVVNDLKNVYRLNCLPFAAVFHDFSLRHPTSGEKVDQAVKDCFGDWPVRHIGARMDGSGEYPTIEKPSADGHWWDVPGSEGAIVDLPEVLLCDPLAKPIEKNPSSNTLFCRLKSLLGVK